MLKALFIQFGTLFITRFFWIKSSGSKCKQNFTSQWAFSDEGDSYGSLSANEDVTIHLHKDGGTGGNICAKIVFFLLFSALIVLVGLIIKENQGLNERKCIFKSTIFQIITPYIDIVDSAEEESRFSQIFEGWVHKSVDEHDDHSPELHSHEESEDEEEYDDHSEESNVEDSEEVQSQEVEQEEDEDSTARSEEDEESQELSSSRRSEDESEVEEDENSPELSEEKNDSSDESLQETEQSKEKSSEEVDETIEDAKTESPDTNDLDKVGTVSGHHSTFYVYVYVQGEDATIPEPQDAEHPAKESSGRKYRFPLSLYLETVPFKITQGRD